jgi:NADPH:quinone reductase-like Zn-dependent oxidoreductase
MRAAVQEVYGPPEVVRVAEVPTPQPVGSQVRVRVQVATVNRTDCAYRAAKPTLVMRPITGLRRPRVATLGCEFAGVVDAKGPDATRYGVGDRVFGYREGAFGGHAEYLVLPDDASLARIPERVSFATAAAATEGAHYALAFLRVSGVCPGQNVMVYGATGAIGSAAVQLCRQRGAQVTAVCDTAHVDLIRDLGADRVIDYLTQDFTADPQTYDVVMDAVGKSSFGRCRGLLTPNGLYVSSELGRGGQNLLLSAVTQLLPGRGVRFPVPRHDQQMITELAALLDSGEFTPVIDRRYRLEQIVDAYRYVETGRKVGNVVIDVGPEAHS